MPKKNNLLKKLQVTKVSDKDLKAIFPKKLTAKHLASLNKVFEDLARGLRQALRIYKTGKNGGRDGAIVALYTMHLVLAHFETFQGEGLDTPIHALENGLQALNNGSQLAIVTPTPSSGQASSSLIRSSMEAWAVVTVERLLRAGMALDEGCEVVAKNLVKAGIKSTRSKAPISGRTVRNWRQRASDDVSNTTPLSQITALFLSAEEENEGTKSEKIEAAIDDLQAMLSQFPAAEYN